jgi:ADP-ribose pyrophosphatase YjhB (NUDIX family)
LQPSETETEFLEKYDPKVFDRPSTAVDNVIYTVFDDSLHVLVVKRTEHPFKGQWALVGGFVDLQNDSDLEATAKRKLVEKTGVITPYLEQFKTIGGKLRDPRGWSLTTVYFALLSSNDITLQSSKTANEIKWVKIINGQITQSLAFDHNLILKECTERLQKKVLYTSLPLHLMPNEFTLNELQAVYEIILGNTIEHKSFRRRMLGAEILQETGNLKQTGKRPAMLYSRTTLNDTHFFVRNLEGKHAS